MRLLSQQTGEQALSLEHKPSLSFQVEHKLSWRLSNLIQARFLLLNFIELSFKSYLSFPQLWTLFSASPKKRQSRALKPKRKLFPPQVSIEQEK